MKCIATIILALICLAQPCIAVENVAGFDFGGKLENYEQLKESNIDGLAVHVYAVPKVKFFDFAQIETDENHIIKAISFTKTYTATSSSLSVEKRTIQNDFKRFVENLSKKYGEFDTTHASKVLGALGKYNSFYMAKIDETAVNPNPKSADIAGIIINLKSPETPDFMLGGGKTFTLTLLYLDKELIKELAKMHDEETSGF